MQTFKNVTITLASIALIAFIVIYFLQRTKSDSLKEKEHSVSVSWSDFASDLLVRDSLLNSFAATSFDSLKYFEQQSILARVKKESNLDLAFFEYKINEYLLAHFPYQKDLAELDKKLNTDLSNYNSQTKDYNVYISTFPNFIVAKRLNYRKAKYFTIKYGETNEDPILKSRELPDWAKSVDTN